MTAHATLVVAELSGQGVWTFDTPIAEVNAIAGLNVAGAGTPQSWELVEPYNVYVTYEEPAVAGQAWDVDPGECDIVFSNGAALAPGTGTVAG